MTKNDLVRDYLTKHPNETSKKNIARQLMKVYPEHFTDLEYTRATVRTVTGSHGNYHRSRISSPELTKFFYNGFEKWASENLNTEIAPWNEPFVIPNSITNLAVIADLHSIHLDHRVLQSLLKNVKDKTAILINGDLLDSESLSRHLKGHNLIEYEKELEICHQILKGLKEEFNHVYFKEGNHDFWLERYLLTNAREIFRLRGLSVKELLRCGELGVEHIHNLKYVQYGDLDICHGHEFPGFGMGKYPATGLIDKWQRFKKYVDVRVMCSHSHRADKGMSKKSVDGKFGLGWVTPAMCRKGAHYAPYAGWDNGWAELENKDGFTSVNIHVE